jgi:hypothetical protein
MDLLKFVEALPDSVKNIVISALLNSAMSAKNVEQDIRTIDVQPIYQNGQLQQQKQHKRQSPQQLLQSMRNGDYNSQYVDYYYEVLKKADDLVLNSTPEQLKLLAERYGMGGQATARYDLLERKQKGLYGNRSTQQIRTEQVNRRVSSDDNYPIERMVTNKRYVQNVLDHAMGAKPIFKYSIDVQWMFQTRYNIEQITEYVHIKILQSEYNGRLIEFYIPKSQGVKNLPFENQAIFEEFKNITEIACADDYGNISSYRIQSFYRLVENGMYDIMKFKANKIEKIGFL